MLQFIAQGVKKTLYRLFLYATEAVRVDTLTYSRIKNQPQQFLYEHRYEVAHLYDIFIEWTRAQLETYSSECMFSIQ